MTVLENVALPAIVAGLPRKQAEIRADLLDLLGLGGKEREARRRCSRDVGGVGVDRAEQRLEIAARRHELDLVSQLQQAAHTLPYE
jgi:ABC-type ATPase involved in cell division